MKYDLHVHTSEISPCARVSAAHMIERYKEAGYDGIVLTNHIHEYSLNTYEGDYKRFLDDYLKAYHLAKEEGKNKGITVLLGAEVCFSNLTGDFLVYGLTEEMLLKFPCLPKMKLSEFNKIKGEDILIFQAHPFRNWMQIADPEYLFGIEVHNGNPRHNSRNDFAKLWAKKHSLSMVSGSDFHELEDVNRGGIYTSQRIFTSSELIVTLKTNNYSLILN